MRHKPLLSICITSYNRINELYRCLDSIDTQYNDSIEIVISEDCSPKKMKLHKLLKSLFQRHNILSYITRILQTWGLIVILLSFLV